MKYVVACSSMFIFRKPTLTFVEGKPGHCNCENLNICIFLVLFLTNSYEIHTCVYQRSLIIQILLKMCVGQLALRVNEQAVFKHTK